MTDHPMSTAALSEFDPNTAPIGDVLSAGSGTSPAPFYAHSQLTPRGVMVMHLIGVMQSREANERDLAQAKRTVKAAKQTAADDDDKVGAAIEALRKLDKGTELEDNE